MSRSYAAVVALTLSVGILAAGCAYVLAGGHLHRAAPPVERPAPTMRTIDAIPDSQPTALPARPVPAEPTLPAVARPVPAPAAGPAPVRQADPTRPGTPAAPPVRPAPSAAPVTAPDRGTAPAPVPVVADPAPPVADVAPEDVAHQLDDERIGRQVDGPDGAVCTVVAVNPDRLACA